MWWQQLLPVRTVSVWGVQTIEKAMVPLNKFANHFLKDGEFVGGDHPSIAEFSILGTF